MKEALSKRYGWKPQEIDEMDPKIIDAYLAIISGQNKRKEAEANRRK